MTLSPQTKVLMALLVMGLMPFFFLAGLVLYPWNPLDIHCVKITNPGGKVVAGTPVTYAVDITKKVSIPGRVLRQLINERVITYTAYEGNVPKGRRIIAADMNTSVGDMPGKYYLRWTVTYSYFGFYDVPVAKDSEVFELVAPPVVRGDKGDTGRPGRDAKGITIFGK
jgi:hypothetical protein